MILSKTDTDTIMHSKLFHGTAESLLPRMASAPDCEMKSYDRGDCIYNSKSFRRSIGIILEGSARVYKENADGRKIIMNTLNVGQLIGAAALFTNDDYIYDIRALESCRVVFFSQRLVMRGFERESRLSENYIRYLSDRILFLNRRISILTAGSAELRLASFFLDNLSDAYFVELPLPMNQLTAELNLSRASLYRALDVILDSGAVIKEGREYKIADMHKLELIAKV